MYFVLSILNNSFAVFEQAFADPCFCCCCCILLSFLFRVHRPFVLLERFFFVVFFVWGGGAFTLSIHHKTRVRVLINIIKTTFILRVATETIDCTS